MKTSPEIVYFDRYEQRLVSEAIYGEKPLRFAYETFLGRLCLEGVIKRRWFSGLYGRWADCGCSASEVPKFIERFGVDVSEFADVAESYGSFNDFFSRELKPEARPIDPDPGAIVFPADGRHLLIPDLSEDTFIYAKGARFDLATFLGDAALADEFAGGSAVLSRLCPTDYHRFHFPASGEAGESRLINGPLYSVNPIALARQPGYLWQNKRRITVVSDSPLGRYLFIEIGATNVGSIVSTCDPGSAVAKGGEKGYFRFGGSMVATVFLRGTLRAAEDLSTQSAAGVELYARMGDRLGNLAD